MNTDTTPNLVLIRKKISVRFADGTQKSNLNVASAVALIANTPSIEVQVDGQNTDAQALFDNLIRESGRQSNTIPGDEPYRYTLAQPSTASVPDAMRVTPSQPENARDHNPIYQHLDAPAYVPATERRIESPAALGMGYGLDVNPPTPSLPVNPSPSLGFRSAAPTDSVAVADLTPKTPPANMLTPDKPTRSAPDRNTTHIVLGPSLVFTDADVALRHLLANTDHAAIMSDHYHNKLTETFKAGSPEGHLKSLFRDFRKYGLRIAPKLQEYRTFVLGANWPSDSIYNRFAGYFTAGYKPTNVATFESGALSNRYFRFWALLTASTMKPADVRSAS